VTRTAVIILWRIVLTLPLLYAVYAHVNGLTWLAVTEGQAPSFYVAATAAELVPLCLYALAVVLVLSGKGHRALWALLLVFGAVMGALGLLSMAQHGLFGELTLVALYLAALAAVRLTRPDAAAAMSAKGTVGSRGRWRLVLGSTAVIVSGLILWSLVLQPGFSTDLLRPGERITLANGLALTVPPAALFVETYRDSATARVPWLFPLEDFSEQLVLVPADTHAWVTISSFSGDPRESPTVLNATLQEGLPAPLAQTPDGQAQIYWHEGLQQLVVLTALPDRAAGALIVTGSLLNHKHGEATDAALVNRALAQLWRELAIEGLALPQVPAE